MTVDKKALRLDGVYPQRQEGFYMRRIKLPAGLISAQQARVVAALARRFARGVVHLTVRESMELHWLREEDLAPVARELVSVGLVSRGACGGAVRGVVCGALGCAAAPRLEALSRRLHRHFTGNPRFEALPKKFKVGLEADTKSGRHLIQDIGLVPAGPESYDVYAAGGLGREPVPGFLLAGAVPEGRLIPLIEAVATVYAKHGTPGKRLKHLVAQVGEEEVRRLVFSDPRAEEELPVLPSLFDTLLPLSAEGGGRVEAPVFAGELSEADLLTLADYAERWSDGILAVTGEQNIAFHLTGGTVAEAGQALQEAGFGAARPRDGVTFRVCPGNHECLFGLCATREVAAAVLDAMGEQGRQLSWAISGCANSCAQPQLAQVGIVSARAEKVGEERVARYDLYRMEGGAFAAVHARGVTLRELLEYVEGLG